jgi:hypothetical protein
MQGLLMGNVYRNGIKHVWMLENNTFLLEDQWGVLSNEKHVTCNDLITYNETANFIEDNGVFNRVTTEA